MKLLFNACLALCLALPLPARAQAAYGDAGAPVAGQVLGSVIRTRDAEELRGVILQRLTDRYAAEHDIGVTPSETEAYLRAMRERMQLDRERQHARRVALTHQLADDALSPAQRRALAVERDDIDRFLAALGDPTRADDPDEARARQEIAAAFIRQWKINGELHRRYGGRIAYQQGGPEPLDAYRRFLEQGRARGDFAIVDPALETPFWRYYRDDSIHDFYPAGSREAAQAFRTPPWQAGQVN